MSNLLLPIQWNGFPANYCFSNWDQLGVDMTSAMQAVLANGRSFYNYGDTQPDPSLQAYPWLNTNDMRWYRYDGVWISNNPRTTGMHTWEEFTAESDIWSYDGGDGTDPFTNPPTDRSGAMWVLDTKYNARGPISPGTGPQGTVIGYGSVGGEDLHTLLTAEMPSHTHPVQTDAVWAAGRDTLVIAEPGANSAGPIGIGATGATGGNTSVTPVVTTPHNNLAPYVGMACIVRSARVYYVA